MKPFSAFFISAVLGTAATLSNAEDYQFISSSTGSVFWNNSNAANWNSNPPWDGIPPAGGPTGDDRLDLAAAAGNPGLYLASGGSDGEGGLLFIDYHIRLITTSAQNQMIRGFSGTRANLIADDIEISGSNASLSISRHQSQAVLNLFVTNDILVGADTTFNIGAPAISTGGGTLSSMQVGGSTIVNGTLLRNRLSSGTSQIHAGDLVVNATGFVSLSSFENGFFPQISG